MKRYPVIFSPRAEVDLDLITTYIADHASARTALNFAERLRAFCRSFETFPERGTRDGRGSRIIGYDRVATIRFKVRADRVEIVTIAYRGRRLD